MANKEEEDPRKKIREQTVKGSPIQKNVDEQTVRDSPETKEKKFVEQIVRGSPKKCRQTKKQAITRSVSMRFKGCKIK